MFEVFDLGSLCVYFESRRWTVRSRLPCFSVLLPTNQAQVVFFFPHHREVILSQRRLDVLLRWTAIPQTDCHT